MGDHRSVGDDLLRPPVVATLGSTLVIGAGIPDDLELVTEIARQLAHIG